MAKAPAAKDDNGQGAAAAAQGVPTLNVLAQYIKDFSFENPNAPNSLRPREKSPNINININVNATALSPSDYEVVLRLDAKATDGADVIFNVELLYAGIFRLLNIAKEAMHPALLIECPRMLFPFARQIVAEATRNGGFPPLMIDPVDFNRLYQSRLAEEQAKAKASN
ncbi:MAG: protein-export protein SecB [Alphaproteobacteria bacterium]|nr:MAG: protein-export protein SecB [Alphaproteobacteria bacterium]